MSNTPTPRSFSVTSTASSDHELVLRPYTQSDFESVVEMYQHFDYSSQKQSLPPRTKTNIREWLENVLDYPSLLVEFNGTVIGHLLFVQDDDDGHELAIFFHSDFQSDEIRSKTIRNGLEYAEKKGLENIWVMTRPDHPSSPELFRDLGFTVKRTNEIFNIVWLRYEN